MRPESTNGARLRTLGVDYLFYALLDAVVDHFFPILESYGQRLEELEELVLDDPGPDVQRAIHGVKRELSILRRGMWPLREVANELYRTDSTIIEACSMLKTLSRKKNLSSNVRDFIIRLEAF